MNSVKTKSANYAMISNKAIGGIVVVPENTRFRIYVAWEWENQAGKGFFAVMKSTGTHQYLSEDHICSTADYGSDITDTPEAKQLFPYLFK